MFVRLLAVASLAAFAVAGSHHARGAKHPKCKGGSVKCCNQLQTPSQWLSENKDAKPDVKNAVIDATALIGLQCLTLSSDTGCLGQTACCGDDSMDGGVNVGCYNDPSL